MHQIQPCITEKIRILHDLNSEEFTQSLFAELKTSIKTKLIRQLKGGERTHVHG